MRGDNQRRERLVTFLASFSLMFMAIIGWRYYHLQIQEGDQWDRRARRQHHRTSRYEGMRGDIYASFLNSGCRAILAHDCQRYHLYIDPSILRAFSEDQWSSYLDQSTLFSDGDRALFLEALTHSSRSRCVKRWYTLHKKERIEGWWKGLATAFSLPGNALYFIADYQRLHPGGASMGALLDTLYEQREEGNRLPIGGLEKFHHHSLKGKVASCCEYQIEALREGTQHMVGKGHNLCLTIDPYLQAVAEQEIARGVQYAQAHSGWAILMDPYDGKIRALAQYPAYDVNHYSAFHGNPDLAPFSHLHPVTQLFEPGSAMKPISLAIGLLANQECREEQRSIPFDPHEMMDIQKVKNQWGKRKIHDVTSHRYLDMELALQKSSNIYCAKVATEVVKSRGAHWYLSQLRDRFGLGKKTGIEIPGENAGSLPHEDNQLGDWGSMVAPSLSFGYQLLVNGVQFMAAWAPLVNGGYSVAPTLLHSELTSSRQRVVPEAISDQIRRALQGVVAQTGTGHRAQVKGYSVGGKSSTTEKVIEGHYSHTAHFSSFIGFAPVEHPRFLLMVAIDEPKSEALPGVGKLYWGGRCAALPFRSIMGKSLRYMGVPPDDLRSFSPDDPRREALPTPRERYHQELKERYEHAHSL
ncbi:MAG: penicillin-binding protein 2 [Chlamydiota bacterium]|nr:penicillin-binding protein 2 [Chlamydiota bacterium]